MDVLEELRWRSTTLAKLDADKSAARREWETAVQRARSEGVPWGVIREVTGASPDTIAKALKRR